MSGGYALTLSATHLGDLAQTGVYQFGTTTLTISDTGVLADLFNNQALSVFMNIDGREDIYHGQQVTLVYAP